ncbi:MAG: sulfotransferase family 2 domain-containing protein [Solidesulfovibrio sp.]|uniref:sulfotransferase family 2 domain-containing protein n=1 Tax=Solidesulfovibrio sp. TaxID=2910990 RepID=UPI003158AA61
MKPIPIIHMHIPKTAGSTTTTMLLQSFRDDEVFLCGNNKFNLNHYQSNIYFTSLPDEEKARYKFIAGHVEFALIQSYPAPHFSFTFLRNPISRINSMYFYIKQNPRHHLHALLVNDNVSMEAFCRLKLWHELDNGMCRRLSGLADAVPYGQCDNAVLERAKYNLTNNISFFGLQERFNESIFLLLYSLDDLSSLEYRRQNTTKVKKNDRSLTDSEHEALTECNQYDLQLYEYARELYAVRNKPLTTLLAKPLNSYLLAMKKKEQAS